MSLSKKKISQEHRNKAREHYDAAIKELGDSQENKRQAEQSAREAQTAHARADELVKAAEALHKFFYPEPEESVEEPEA